MPIIRHYFHFALTHFDLRLSRFLADHTLMSADCRASRQQNSLLVTSPLLPLPQLHVSRLCYFSQGYRQRVAVPHSFSLRRPLMPCITTCSLNYRQRTSGRRCDADYILSRFSRHYDLRRTYITYTHENLLAHFSRERVDAVKKRHSTYQSRAFQAITCRQLTIRAGRRSIGSS